MRRANIFTVSAIFAFLMWMGVIVADNVIKGTFWGEIKGNIARQSDLQNVFAGLEAYAIEHGGGSSVTPTTAIDRNMTLAENSENANNLANQLYSVELPPGTSKVKVMVRNVMSASTFGSDNVNAAAPYVSASYFQTATVTADGSPSAATLTNSGVADSTDGKGGHGGTFVDTESDTMTIATAPAAFKPSAKYSVSTWIKFTSIDDADIYVLYYFPTATHATGLTFRYLSGAYRFYTSLDTDAADVGEYTVTWTPAADTWYHVAVVVDLTITGDELKYYVDGTLIGSVTVAGSSIVNPTSIFIGSEGGTTRYFNGTISKFHHLKDYALSQSEVTALYNAGAGLTYAQTKLVITPASGKQVKKWTTAADKSIVLSELGQTVELDRDSNGDWWPRLLIGTAPTEQ